MADRGARGPGRAREWGILLVAASTLTVALGTTPSATAWPLGTGAPPSPAAVTATTTRPNFVVVVTDDQRWDSIGRCSPTFDGFDFSAGPDSCIGGGAADTLTGRGGDDTLIGGAGGDTLGGDSGRDTLRGGIGPDGLTGGPGNDALYGGPGTDTCRGGNGTDTADASCEAIITVP